MLHTNIFSNNRIPLLLLYIFADLHIVTVWPTG